MKSKPPKDLAASVRQRLLQRSTKDGIDFQLTLTRYAIERLLYRLGQSPHRPKFVLKGAMLFIAWEGWSPRPTRDVDLLGSGDSDGSTLKSIFASLCRLEVEPDGLTFDPDTIKVADIREEQEYGGKRVRLRATLGSARIEVQVDIGYGDTVFPAPTSIDFPTLLNLPSPNILGYSRESVVAEKLEALVKLGMVNSRMKDFYDLWSLAQQFSFDGITLAKAILATFQRRRTPLPTETPIALTAEFSNDATRRKMWSAFVSKNRLAPMEVDLETVILFLQTFLWPPLQHLTQGKKLRSHWRAGKSWKEAKP